MGTTSKFFLKSLSVWGVTIGALCSFIHNRTGVNLSDQVGPLQQTIQAIINTAPPFVSAIGAFAGVVMAIVGRFRAVQPLHIVAPKVLPPNSPLTKPA